MNDLSDTKNTIITHSLSYVGEMGWTFPALIKGAETAGIDSSQVRIAFEGREKEAIKHFSVWIDQKMVQKIRQSPDFETLKVHEKVRFSILTRFEILNLYKKAAVKAFKFLASPGQASLAPKLMYNTVNTIWYEAGDISTDYNFYTKRALLTGVYGATLLFWMRQEDPHLSKTEAFLDKRLAEIAQIPRLKNHFREGAKKYLSPVGKIFKGFFRR